MKTGAAPLVARATEFEPEAPLLAYHQPGEGFTMARGDREIVAIGVARAVRILGGPDQAARAAAAAAHALRAVDGRAVVVGALPFDGHVPATLVIPRCVLLREGSRVTRIDVGGQPMALEPAPMTAHARSDVALSAVPDEAAYVDAVRGARDRIRAGALRKVVLARMLVAQASHPFDRRALLARLREAEPDAYVFAVAGFIGASPELLASRFGPTVRSVPLAGTAARRSDPDGAGLLSSAKDRAEHAFVADAVREVLAELCGVVAAPSEPVVHATRKLWHLATPFEGIVRDPASTVMDVVARLHPTPAVCGTPRADAMRAIAELEEIDRALYAGCVGWMDSDGDGEWAVGLRCAEVQGNIALTFAGAGIVADSDPDAELAETDVKMRAMLDALGYA